MPDVVDRVQHPPGPTEPGAVDTGELFTQRLTDSPGVDEKRAGDELYGRFCHLGRESGRKSPTSWSRSPQLEEVGHET